MPKILNRFEFINTLLLKLEETGYTLGNSSMLRTTNVDPEKYCIIEKEGQETKKRFLFVDYVSKQKCRVLCSVASKYTIGTQYIEKIEFKVYGPNNVDRVLQILKVFQEYFDKQILKSPDILIEVGSNCEEFEKSIFEDTEDFA